MLVLEYMAGGDLKQAIVSNAYGGELAWNRRV